MIDTNIHNGRTTNEITQRRKWKTQMNEEEIILCSNLVKQAFQNKGIRPSYHLVKDKSHYNMGRICQTIMDSNLPKYVKEYNERKKFDKRTGEECYTQRVLLYIPIETKFRCSKTGNILWGYMSFTYEISTGLIITAYYNETKDSLRTPDLSYYEENLEVTQDMKDGYKQPNKYWN